MTIATPRFRVQAFNIMTGLNVFLLVMALFLASWYDSWLAALLIGVPTAIVPILLYRMLGDHILARVSFGIGFMFFAALHIHQAAGMIEVHFGIFVLLAILIGFRDYLVIVAAAATIAVHHLLFMYLQMQGGAVFLVPADDLSFGIVFVHAIYVVVESAVLVILSRQSYREAVVGQVLFDITDSLLTNDGKVVLTDRCPEINSKVISGFNAVLNTLQATIKTIEQQADTLKGEAKTLLDEGDALSDGMAQKMIEVDRIAAATEQMSHTVKEVFDLSQNVLKFANTAENAAVEGKISVSNTIHAVQQLAKELEDTGDKVNDVANATVDIRKVLDVIEAIAEQTNLLALNAAIEAARAGEQGRGFAVVADEVRTLASRTRGSTDEIKLMIERLVTNSTQSVEVVKRSMVQLEDTRHHAKQSGELLQAILGQAQHVVTSTDVMSNSLQQQTASSNEIAQSAQQLSQMTMSQNEQGQKVLRSADSLERISSALSIESSKFLV
ncbi:methyl-accepting chemotaxis protein [Rheinheimera baltica]|uniref:methyl-accepting chemotaxis protein n=1 Tax=Rheinheimera baltica TaxID=67576 RepID=UPI00273D3E33|nr:methyl-accepting chemotaxis protein [Rheinheimera baltica]MDP5148757.1 methyl-accepting chemotaxis protein [Rheinheimera baltica]